MTVTNGRYIYCREGRHARQNERLVMLTSNESRTLIMHIPRFSSFPSMTKMTEAIPSLKYFFLLLVLPNMTPLFLSTTNFDTRLNLQKCVPSSRLFEGYINAILHFHLITITSLTFQILHKYIIHIFPLYP